MTSRLYKDIDPVFTAHPVTGDVSAFDDEMSIKFSIKNLILTMFGERFYERALGSNVPTLLFDLNDPTISISLERAIRETIQNYEPRAKLMDVKTTQYENSILVSITYRINTSPLPSTLNLTLKRVR